MDMDDDETVIQARSMLRVCSTFRVTARTSTSRSYRPMAKSSRKRLRLSG